MKALEKIRTTILKERTVDVIKRLAERNGDEYNVITLQDIRYDHYLLIRKVESVLPIKYWTNITVTTKEVNDYIRLNDILSNEVHLEFEFEFCDLTNEWTVDFYFRDKFNPKGDIFLRKLEEAI